MKNFKGLNNPNYKTGKYLRKYFCIDCKKKISIGSSRCMLCSNKIKARNKQSKNSNYRRQPTCIDCGKILKNCYAKRCLSCSMKNIRKTKNWVSTKGRMMSLEQKIKISITRKERKVAVKEKNPNWKGYNLLKDLDKAIRDLTEYNDWRIKNLKRDNYTCQECGHIGRPLEVHHKKEFRIILKEFLNFYSQFSPIEDKETLLRLSLSWKEFWDVSLGITLCKKCHNKTKYFLNKATP